MKIEKFNEDYDPNDGFDYPYGGHTFVLARYKKGWNNLDRKSTRLNSSHH